jgi:hypothetical protein
MGFGRRVGAKRRVVTLCRNEIAPRITYKLARAAAGPFKPAEE